MVVDDPYGVVITTVMVSYQSREPGSPMVTGSEKPRRSGRKGMPFTLWTMAPSRRPLMVNRASVVSRSRGQWLIASICITTWAEPISVWVAVQRTSTQSETGVEVGRRDGRETNGTGVGVGEGRGGSLVTQDEARA